MTTLRGTFRIAAAALALAGAIVAASARDGIAAAKAASPALRAAPVLDKAKGDRAVAAYRKYMNELCDSLWQTPEGKPMRPQWDPNNYGVEKVVAPHEGDGPARERLKAIGLSGASAEDLCAKHDLAARPVASGAFLVAGADEVLLEVWNGTTDIATAKLALMRVDRGAYRFVTHLAVGGYQTSNRFEARLRMTTASKRDVLLLCESGGIQGVYPTRCGFFGHGSFREESAVPPTTTDEATAKAEQIEELFLMSIRTCGPTVSVEWGKATARADRVLIDIAVVKAVRKPIADEAQWDCGQETDRTSKTFTIEYRFDGARFHRVAPLPPEVNEALGRN